MLAGMPRAVSPNSFSVRDSLGANLASKYELLAVGIALALFLALCTGIQGRYIPWGDEVQFVDPAANLYYQAGFVSTEWSNQTDRTFWCGNAPAYSALLYLGFQTFHFSQAVARSVTAVTMALAVFFLWVGVRRARFLSHPNTRLLLLVLVLTGYGGYLCYSNIRYESLCLLECSLALLAYSLTRPLLRNACLFVVGVCMLLTNLQLPQYALALVLILSYAYSQRFALLWRLRFLYLGNVAGGAALILLYASHNGALNAFRINLRQQAGQPLGEKLHHFSFYFQYDASLVALLLFLLVSLAIVSRSPQPEARRSILAGLLICTTIPLFFFLARRFVFSSAWMVYVPAAVFVCRILDAKIHRSASWKTFAVLCCAAAIAFGLPKALLGIATDWQVRSYAVVDRFVAANVGTNDIAFCEPAAYFAARPRAARVYGPGYLDVMNAAEKKAITVILVAPPNQAEILRNLGGKWITIQQLVRDSRSSPQAMLPFSTNFSCRLNVLRRLDRLN